MVLPQSGTRDTAVGAENQPAATRGGTELGAQEFSVSNHTSQIMFPAHSLEVWRHKLSPFPFLKWIPGAGPSDVYI